MNIKQVRNRFDEIDEVVPVDRGFDSDPVHCTSEESCARLAQRLYDLVLGGDE